MSYVQDAQASLVHIQRCVCVCVPTLVYIQVCVYVCVPTLVYIQVCVCVHVPTLVYIQGCIHIYVPTLVHIQVYVCVLALFCVSIPSPVHVLVYVLALFYVGIYICVLFWSAGLVDVSQVYVVALVVHDLVCVCQIEEFVLLYKKTVCCEGFLKLLLLLSKSLLYLLDFGEDPLWVWMQWVVAFDEAEHKQEFEAKK